MVVSTELLEEENRATDVSAVQKARDFYMSCVNEGTCEQSRLLRELRHASMKVRVNNLVFSVNYVMRQ